MGDAPQTRFLMSPKRPRADTEAEVKEEEKPKVKRTRTKSLSLTLDFDGAAFPTNPGPAGAGWLIYDDTTDTQFLIGAGFRYLGDPVTNNEAEYEAMHDGLVAVMKLMEQGMDIERLSIRGDSTLVINQMTGLWGCKAPGLIPKKARARELTAKLKALGLTSCTYTYIPRGQNEVADLLSKFAVRRQDKAQVSYDMEQEVVQGSKVNKAGITLAFSLS